MSWPDGEHYFCPLQSLVVSFLLSLISALVFSRTGSVLSHRNSSTHRFLQFPQRNLCSLITLAVPSRLCCNGHSLLLSSYVFRIGRIEILHASPADTRPRTPLISFCTIQLRTLSTARSLAILCLSTTFGSGLGEMPSFWGSVVFHHAPIPRKGSGNNNMNFSF